ncbi:MAG: hypothetical protein IJW57_01315 [Spirochaetaceae bacterium]|nr:hypothetical protein [Spirochaetaceae bacterium]
MMTEYDYATDMAVLKEEAYEDGLFVGREEGAYQNKLETARNLLAMGLEPEQVAQGTGLSLKVIQKLID